MEQIPIPSSILAAIADYPTDAGAAFRSIRAVIFEEAQRLEAGPLEETLKWGEPAYLTPVTKSGSTIRMAWKSTIPDTCNLYLNCKTDIVDRFKSDFPGAFQTTTNRCVHIPFDSDFDQLPLRSLIGMALTYHRRT